MKRLSAVTMLLLATMAVAIQVSSISYVKAEEPTGFISIVFDDNYQNQYDYAFPLMKKYGITGTFYICTSNLGKSGYMIAGQLQTLANNGNEIGSHSHTHITFTSLSEDQIRYQCSYSKQILEGFGLTVTNFAYPNGPTNDTVDAIVSEYYRSGRTAYIEPYIMEVPTTQFRISGFSAETADSTALSLLKGMVDEVYATDGWAIIFFHNIIPHAYSQPYTTSAEDFESFLNYTITKGVQALTVNQVLNLTSLSTEANFGTVSPTSGLYSLGNTLSIEAFSPPVVDGERYVWLGWTGSGAGSYSGSNNPASITLNSAISETAMWRHEFRLSVFAENGGASPSMGEHWYEAENVVNIEAFSPTAESGERYLWNGWTGTGPGSYSGSNTYATLVMNSPITQATVWTHQYFVNVSSVFGVVGGTGWYNSGATTCFTLDKSIVNESLEVRHVFTGWNEDTLGTGLTSELITVDGPKSAFALWKKQYLVVFDQTGLPHDFSAPILTNNTVQNLPLSLWIDEGDSLQFEFNDQFTDGFARYYILTFPLNQSSFTANSSVRIIAQYDLQYNLNLLALIACPLILVFLLAIILLFRKKKSAS